MNFERQTPVILPTKRRWVAHCTEGLVGHLPIFLLLIDCCVHREGLNEMNSTICGKYIELGFYTQNLCQLLCLSVCVSVWLSMFPQNMKAEWTDGILHLCRHGFVVNYLYTLNYVICLDIQKSVCIICFHYINHLLSHQYFQYLFKLMVLILFSIRLHYTDNSSNKIGVIYNHSYLQSMLDFVITSDCINKRIITKCFFAVTKLMTAANIQLWISL